MKPRRKPAAPRKVWVTLDAEGVPVDANFTKRDAALCPATVGFAPYTVVGPYVLAKGK